MTADILTRIWRSAEHSMQVSISRNATMMGAITASRVPCSSPLRSSLHPTTITGASNWAKQNKTWATADKINPQNYQSIPAVSAEPHLEAPEFGEPEWAEPLQRRRLVTGVGEHHHIRRLALGDQLRPLLWAESAIQNCQRIKIHKSPNKKKYTRKSSVRGSGGPGGGVDDGDGDAVGEVVDGEAGGGQYAGDVASVAADTTRLDLPVPGSPMTTTRKLCLPARFAGAAASAMRVLLSLFLGGFWLRGCGFLGAMSWYLNLLWTGASLLLQIEMLPSSWRRRKREVARFITASSSPNLYYLLP